jgi:hypothetical protein
MYKSIHASLAMFQIAALKWYCKQLEKNKGFFDFDLQEELEILDFWLNCLLKVNNQSIGYYLKTNPELSISPMECDLLGNVFLKYCDYVYENGLRVDQIYAIQNEDQILFLSEKNLSKVKNDIITF